MFRFPFGNEERSSHLLHQSLFAFVGEHTLWDGDIDERAKRCLWLGEVATSCISPCGDFRDVGQNGRRYAWIAGISDSFPFDKDPGEVLKKRL
jgi:hypothetical protein